MTSRSLSAVDPFSARADFSSLRCVQSFCVQGFCVQALAFLFLFVTTLHFRSRRAFEMPSFTSRRYTPDRFRSLSKPEDDLMEDITHTMLPSHKSTTSGSLTLAPSDGSLLDYFDLPSPPSTPHRPTHSLSYSALNSFPSPATSPGLIAGSPASLSSISSSSSSRSSSSNRTTSGPNCNPSPPTSIPPRWPTASQRMHHHRLPLRPRSRSASSASSSGSSASAPGLAGGDIEMGGTGGTGAGTGGVVPLVRMARRTPYYPPNSSRNVDRARVYMNRGPHYVPNWTPLSSLPRHVQLQIEERMVKFTAL